ncbi:MAG: DUF2470 domain-containing protein [Pseudomonadota bacterium]
MDHANSAANFSTQMNETDELGRLAKGLLRGTRHGTLSVLNTKEGAPVSVRVGIATDIDGAPVLVMPDEVGALLNSEASQHGSLLLIQSDPSSDQSSLRLAGRFERVIGDNRAWAMSRYAARHPNLEVSQEDGPLNLYRLEVSTGQLTLASGQTFNLQAEHLMSVAENIGDWGMREHRAREHMNDDHADAVALYAEKLAGRRSGEWVLTGIDPEGIDMTLGDDHCRVWFDEPLSKPDEMHHTLVDLVKHARLMGSEAPTS